MKTIKDWGKKQKGKTNVTEHDKGEKGCYVSNFGIAPLRTNVGAETWMISPSQPREIGGRGIHKMENQECKRPWDRQRTAGLRAGWSIQSIICKGELDIWCNQKISHGQIILRLLKHHRKLKWPFKTIGKK